MTAYWLDLFTHETWSEFLAAGGKVSGFRESRWNTVQKMRSGDILLCYLTGVSRSRPRPPRRQIGAAYSGSNSGDERPPVSLSRPQESYAWTGHFRGSPNKWTIEDGSAVVDAVMDATARPVARSFDPKKLIKVPPILKSKVGSVTVPDDDDDEETESSLVAVAVSPSSQPGEEIEAKVAEATAHTEMQWLLLKLGNDMGLDVWVAKNDRNRSYDGVAFGSLPRSKKSLPLQFDEATTKTIELIDVLWLKGNSIQAAFEIESTTQVFSGLLRMADLITMQPNLNIPLYIVAPSDRRNKVRSEVNRPTFARLNQPMAELCRFISFEELRAKVEEAKSVLKYLKPEFLDSFSETCEIEDA